MDQKLHNCHFLSLIIWANVILNFWEVEHLSVQRLCFLKSSVPQAKWTNNLARREYKDMWELWFLRNGFYYVFIQKERICIKKNVGFFNVYWIIVNPYLPQCKHFIPSLIISMIDSAYLLNMPKIILFLPVR